MDEEANKIREELKERRNRARQLAQQVDQSSQISVSKPHENLSLFEQWDSTERKQKKEKALYPDEIVQKSEIFKTDEKYFIEEPDKDTGCMKFYYANPDDFQKFNISCGKRPWIPSGRNPQNLKGKIAFNDAMLYRPGDMYDYVKKWYIDDFAEKGVLSPFAFPESNIFMTQDEICNSKEFKLQPHQMFIPSLMSNQTDFGSILVIQKIGAGKCAKFDTPTLMYNGSIKMVQDVKVGDLLMGEDSLPRKVLSLGQGQDIMYEVIPTKGESYTFNSEHILSLKCTNVGVHYVNKVYNKDGTLKKTEVVQRWIATWFNNQTIKLECKYFTTETEAREHLEQFTEESKYCDISIKDYLKLSKRIQNMLKLYRVPVEFPLREVPFDPYIIGLWIGDGDSNGPGFTSQDSAIIVYLNKKLPEYNMYLSHNTTKEYGYRIMGSNNKNRFLDVLRELNLLDNKHIPDLYKINSRQIRLELLAGLIDTDGHLDHNGTYEFVQKDETTMDGVIYLARSLGFSAYKATKKTSWTYNGVKNYGTAFRTTISGNIEEIPVKIERKKAEPRPQVKDVLVTGFKLVKKPIDTYYGFTLDGNHRYLLGNFTVTHNTITGTLTGLFNAGSYIKDGEFKVRGGSTIPHKSTTGSYIGNKPCNITIVVPKQTINQYIKEIRGSLENGELRSATGACVYSENEDTTNQDHIYLRQFYTGQINKSGKPVSEDIENLNRIQNNIARLQKKYYAMSVEDYEAYDPNDVDDDDDDDGDDDENDIIFNEKTDKWEVSFYVKNKREKFGNYEDVDEADKVLIFVKDKLSSGLSASEIKNLISKKKAHQKELEINKKLTIERQKEMGKIVAEIEKLQDAKKSIVRNLDMKIEKVFFLVSHDTFLNRITTKRDNHYMASEYLLGQKHEKKLPLPDCFHSDKAVLIIDEVQKVTMEGGTNYLRLYDTLMLNARDKLTGEPRMKVILLTATPIFDNPHEASLIINFGRPRIRFPLGRMMFEDFFIDKTNRDYPKIKNKLCYQYLSSGYVSYSQGANPKGFPLRRNIIQLHVMSPEQFTGYIKELVADVKKDSEDKSQDPTATDFFDKIYRNSMDDNQQGRYLLSRQLCNIHFPSDGERKRGKYVEGDVKKKEAPAKKELEQMIKQLKILPREYILEAFKKYSPKFHFILKKIEDSWEHDEGPIVVHCEWVWYGILAMTRVLELLGWEFLNSSDFTNSDKKRRFGIWSGDALKFMGIKNTYDQDIYTNNLREMINHKDNANGRLCKVLFTTVTEGISLNRICQLHITSPWWNESRMEQIGGRGNRFRSHCDLPEERRFIDIYYHCSVLETFANYPEINNTVSLALGEAIIGKPETEQRGLGAIQDLYKTKNKSRIIPKYFNYKDMARLTIEQKVYMAARRKTDINTLFEIALKETAVDNQLNTYGNLIRFEEVVNPGIVIWAGEKRYSQHPLSKIFYSRSENKYYFYQINTDKLYNLTMEKLGSKYNIETDKKLANYPVWPSQRCVIGDLIDPNENWLQYEKLTLTNYKKEIMISYIVTETIVSFNNKPEIRDKNFKELMKYAIENGEEEKVWNHFEDQRIRTTLFNILAGLYGLPEGTGTPELLQNFNKVILSHGEMKNQLLRGTATKLITEQLYKKTEDPNIADLLDKLPDEKQVISEQKVKTLENRLNKLHFLSNYEKLREYKKILVEKYRYNKAWIETLSPDEIVTLYYNKDIEMRNKVKS